MTIRGRFLRLLLAISLIPLMVAMGMYRHSMHDLRDSLVNDTRTALIDNAKTLLRRVVDDYARIVDRDKKSVEVATKVQAREAEKRLADPNPPRAPMFFCENYDEGVNLPPGMVASQKHLRTGPDGKRAPIQVTYDDQVYFIVKDVDRQAIARDLASLSTMPEVYRFLYDEEPDKLYWQYTALESGIHTSYPGHGGYPAEYDPRVRAWYLLARKEKSFTWFIMPEVSTRTVALAAAAPLYRPDGAFAGVTAIDVPLTAIFKGLRLPPQWVGRPSRGDARRPGRWRTRPRGKARHLRPDELRDPGGGLAEAARLPGPGI